MERRKKFKVHKAHRFRNSSYSQFDRQHWNGLQALGASNSQDNADVQGKGSDSEEIPGFYFDPVNKTYFRLTSENYKHFVQQELKTKNLPQLGTSDYKKRTGNRRCLGVAEQSLISEIVGREYQSVPCEIFPSRVINMRLKMMKEVYCTRFDHHDFLVEHCQMMIGNPSLGSVIGAWTTPVGTVIYNHCLNACCQERTDSHDQTSVVNIHYREVMTDMCVVRIRDGLECVLYVGNPSRPSVDMNENQSAMHVYPIRQLCDTSTPENRYALDAVTLNMEHDKGTLWSCAWNQNTQKMVFGSEGLITLVSISNGSRDYTTTCSMPVSRENVFALEFNKQGNQLLCGTNKGNLKLFDLRSNKLVLNTTLTRGLSNLKLIGSEERVIASCYDHRLLQFDLKAQKAVVEYCGHNNEHLKLPISISEKNGFVSSVGQDRFVRIWNLKHGQLLWSLPPLFNNSCHPYGWFSEDWDFGTNCAETALIVNVGTEIHIYKP